MSQKNDEAAALNRLANARSYLLNRAPYVASTLLNLSPVPVWRPEITMGVTRGMVLYVGMPWLLTEPEFKDEKTRDAIIGGCLYHECEHPLRGFDRLEALPNKDMANIAGDLAINCVLLREGFLLPSWVVVPEKFGFEPFLTMEQYYHLLEEKMQSTQSNLQSTCEKAMGGQGKGSPGQSKGDSGQGAGGWQPKVGSGACGGAAGGVADPSLEATLDSEHGKSDIEVEAARHQTLDEIQSYAKQHGAGSVPGHYESLIETRYTKPAVNWRRIFSNLLSRAAGNIMAGGADYSMNRPSMSSGLLGIIQPGLVDMEIEIVVIRDTSLSMGDEELQQVNNEIFHVLKKTDVEEIWVVDADTQVHSAKRVKIRDIPKLNAKGRGGTDFHAALEYVRKKLRPRPQIAVYMTDGDGSAPKKAPRGIAIIWCIVKTDYARRPATWGTLVVCDKNQTLKKPNMRD